MNTNNIKDNLVRVLFNWLPVGGTVVLMSGLLYGVIQQNYRTSLNDPQVQIAEDVSTGLSAGRSLNPLTPQVDLAKSLANFITIYDDNGKPMTSSGILDGKMATPPQGVFDYAREHGENRITWEPEAGTRIAIVVARFSNTSGSGFVLAGRNMREVEKRIMDLTKIVGLGCLLALIITFVLDYISDAWRRISMAKPQLPEVPENEELKI